MAVTYSSGTATVSGGTSGAPYDLDDVVTAVADTSLASLDGDGTYYLNVNIDIQGWFKINDDANVITHGYIKKSSGGMIHGYRSVLRYEGAGQGGDSVNSTFPNGFDVHSFKDVAGKNPAVYIQTSGREDAFAAHYPSGATVDFNITGLDLLILGAAQTSAKVYLASGGILDGVSFYRYTSSTNAEIQFLAGDYNDFYLLNATISTGVASGIVLNCYNWSFDFNGSSDNLIFNFNNTTATANIINPSFPNGAWTGSYEGQYGGFKNSTNCVANVLYTYQPTFLQGVTGISGVDVKYTRNDSTTIIDTSDANGETSATQLLTSYRAGGSTGVLAATATYTWSAVARSYDKLVAGSESLFTTKSFTEGESPTYQMSDVPNLNVTKAAAQALTGISVSGTTITVTSSHDTDNIFAAYRLFISDTDNFITADSVTHADNTLTLDTWTVSIGSASAADGLSFDGGVVTLTSATAYTMTLTTNTVNVNATGTFDLTGCTIAGTITLDTNTTGVTVQLPDGTTYVNNDPTNITVEVTIPSLSVSVTSIPDAVGANNRLQIINSTALSASDWQASTAYSLGDIVKRTSGIGTENTAGLFFRCTTAGTSGGTEPTWVITTPGMFGTSGSTTTDGTAEWTCFAILAYDADPAGTSLSTSYFDGKEFKEGESFELRFAEEDPATTFKSYSTTGLATASGISVLVNTEADGVYAENALGGAAQDGIYSPSYDADGEIDYIVMDTNADFRNPKTFAYYCYLLTTSQGMYELWGGVTAIDAGNYRNNVDVAKIMFNETAGYVKQEDSDNSRWFNSDGSRPFLDPTTGGAGIHMNWKNPVHVTEVNTGSAVNQATVQAALTAQGYTTTRAPNLDNADAPVSTVDANVDAILVDTGTTLPATLSTIEGKVDTVDAVADSIKVDSTIILADTNELQTNQGQWVTATGFATTEPDNAGIAAIQAKTDSLTFTKAGEVDSNVQSINDTTLTGDGSTTPVGAA